VEHKERTEIRAEVAAKVLFLADRVCCVCRQYRKSVQIHHIDEDPANGQQDNLAVLCLECHRETQIRGGFDRKLDAHQILLYRDDWYRIVDLRRHGTDAPAQVMPPNDQDASAKVVEVLFEKKRIHLRYLQLTEKDEEHRYSFDADYPQITPEESIASAETNLSITAFVTRELQRFRFWALETSSYKAETQRERPNLVSNWDDLSISHRVGLFTERLLTLEFEITSYGAGAAHPNHNTSTLNFLLNPSLQFELADLFHRKSGYLDVISKFCVSDLHARLPPELKANYSGEGDNWIKRGAGPESSNFQKFLLVKGGVRFFFDPYSVGSYAEGRHEVLVPISVIGSLVRQPFQELLK